MFLSNLALDASSEPTLFELSMAASLSNSLRPAFDYFIHVFAARGSPAAAFAVENQNEVYAVLLGFVQRYYLAECAASFEENFYGLKRKSLAEDKLSPKQKLTSLLELVALPYIKSKWNQHKYPFVRFFCAAYELFALMFQLGYLFNRTKFYTPLLWLQGICIARLTGDDMKKVNERAAAAAVSWSTSKFQFFVQRLTSALLASVILGAFVFKLF